MEDKNSQAVEYMHCGYSCSQSVLCEFCEDAKLSHDNAQKNCRPISRRTRDYCVEDSVTILKNIISVN